MGSVVTAWILAGAVAAMTVAMSVADAETVTAGAVRRW